MDDDYKDPIYPSPMNEEAAGQPQTTTGHSYQQATPGSERLSLYNIEDAFQYRRWNDQQEDAGAHVRDALVNAAKVILRTVPETPLRTRALNMLIDARMVANAAITFRGRF